MTYLGAELRFTAPTVFAITGAEMAPALDAEPIETWRSTSRAGGLHPVIRLPHLRCPGVP